MPYAVSRIGTEISVVATKDGTPPGRLTVSTHSASDGRFRLAVAGELDIASVDELRAALSAALDQGPSAVLVDLDALTFMDSTGISALVAAHRQAAAGGVVLTVVNSRGIVRRVLELTGTLSQLTGGREGSSSS
jgi:anti-anti-sigma factor